MSDAVRLDTMVKIDGWDGSQWFLVTGGMIYLQIYTYDCVNSVRDFRLKMIVERLDHYAEDYGYSIENFLSGCFLMIKPKTMPADPCAFLSELLDRDVTLVE